MCYCTGFATVNFLGKWFVKSVNSSIIHVQVNQWLISQIEKHYPLLLLSSFV